MADPTTSTQPTTPEAQNASERPSDEQQRSCGAQDWGWNDDRSVHIYGTCQRPAGHGDRWHSEWRDGKLWAEWSGPVQTAPENAIEALERRLTEYREALQDIRDRAAERARRGLR